MSLISKLVGGAAVSALLATSVLAQDASTSGAGPAVTARSHGQALPKGQAGAGQTAAADQGAQGDATATQGEGTDMASGSQSDPSAGSGQSMGEGAAGQEQMAALEVGSQPVEDGAVTIDFAYMPEMGFVALHPVMGGKLSPDAVGHAEVPAGESTDLAVELDQEVPAGTQLVAVLHRDTGESGRYEFGARSMQQDQPELIAGRMIAIPFVVTGEGGAQAAEPAASHAQPSATAPQEGATQSDS